MIGRFNEAVPSKKIVYPGDLCRADFRKATASLQHAVHDPLKDKELQAVYAWLMAPERNLAERIVVATEAAIKYVLDGARTKRLDLFDPSVDKDERSSVGTKLQYHVLEELELEKLPPLDTIIENVPVELKSTVRRNWTIPVEGQCQVTMLIRADPAEGQVAAWLIRTHRAILNDGTNQDKKRTISLANFDEFALPLVSSMPLPAEPLKLLLKQDADIVLGRAGIERRLGHLFAVLPDTVLPRTSMAIVGGSAGDFMKRARVAKAAVAESKGNLTLVAKWASQCSALRQLGFDVIGKPWVSVSPERLRSHSGPPMDMGINIEKQSDRYFLDLVNLLPADVRHDWEAKFPDLKVNSQMNHPNGKGLSV